MKWEKKNEGFTTVQEVVEFNTGMSTDRLLNPVENPYLKGLKKAVFVTKSCVAKNMPIRIVGDYDVDGVTSSSILALGLEEYTGVRPEVIIPKRFSEGYGINMSIIDRIDSGLIITVDNGITAVEQIQAAKDKGLVVIIIDHHIIRDDGKIPNADAILDPHAIQGSEYEEYCGAGLAYRFIMELYPDTKLEQKLIALAGIGTIADVMTLQGDNRRLVLRSLEAVRSGTVTYGLKALIDAAGIEFATESDYGFKIGPCINASGRLYDDGGYKAYKLLSSDPDQKSYDFLEVENRILAETQSLIDINKERKMIVYDSMELAEKKLSDKEVKKPIILYDNSFSEGIVGIIAGKLAERYQMPALVFTDSHKNGIVKGSGRSGGNIHLKELLDQVSDLFVKYGGHAGAAGMSLEKEKLPVLQERLSDLLKNVPTPKTDTIYYDLDLKEQEIPVIFKELEKYVPYGEGNPKVRFRLNDFIASPIGGTYYTVMGELKNHIKIFGQNLSILGFDFVSRYLADEMPMSIDLIGELSVNYFNGKKLYQIEMIDYKIRESKKTEVYQNLQELFSFK